MDDLIKLNRRIAMHWLGGLDADQETYLNYVPVCLGEFSHSAAALAEFLTRSKHAHYNPLSVAKLNQQYLRFARLASTAVAAGKVEMLAGLTLDFSQAESLSQLNNAQINVLAFCWKDGEIIRFDTRAFIHGAALNARAARVHAIGFVATRLAT